MFFLHDGKVPKKKKKINFFFRKAHKLCQWTYFGLKIRLLYKVIYLVRLEYMVVSERI